MMSNQKRTRSHSVDPARGRDSNLPRITESQIRQYEPNLRWFIRSGGGIHGLGHETRVLIWSQVLAEMVRQEGLSVDAAVVGWAAAVHDTRRWDDGDDPDHGTRAADWLANHPNSLPPTVPMVQVQYLCRWHVPPDHMVPEMTTELRVFKDADALDRWRIGDLNPSFLRTASARKLLLPSHALWTATASMSGAEQAFTDILAAAQALGILARG
jgi:hypothetical protein